MAVSLKDKIVVITGASSGIGEACAEQFAAQGANIILIARRFERISEHAKKLEQQYAVKALPLKLDVRNKQQVKTTIENLNEEWKSIDIIVNNAGVGTTFEVMQNANPDDWDIMIDTNIKGLLYVTRAILPNMIKRNAGHIVNIGSTSAHAYYKGSNVYSASKHAINALTHCLRIDLNGYQLRVSEIDPGTVKTEFNIARMGKEKTEKFYSGFQPLLAADIADAVIYCVTRPPHVNVAEILVYPTAQATPSILHREGGWTFEE